METSLDMYSLSKNDEEGLCSLKQFGFGTHKSGGLIFREEGEGKIGAPLQKVTL
mgnify:CR=1 FL=1